MNVGNARYFAALVCAIALLPGCTDSQEPATDDSDTQESTSPVALPPPGETVRGWPVKSLSCPLPDSDRLSHLTRFNTVTSLVVCDRKGEYAHQTELATTDPGFHRVMKSLAAKDAKQIGLGCTGDLLHPSQHNITVLASTAGGSYEVAIPYDLCHEMQYDVSVALEAAGINMPLHTDI